MKKLIISYALLVLSMAMMAQQKASEVVLPNWFLQPEEHTYVGISEPDGNVQDAINAALLHYLISSDFKGKMYSVYSAVQSSSYSHSEDENAISLDTTLHFSIKEIISTPQNEYVCRITDSPCLARRIVMTYHTKDVIDLWDDKDTTIFTFTSRCLFEDNSGKSVKDISLEYHSCNNGEKSTYKYISQYQHENGLSCKYQNSKIKTALGEQLIHLYLERLIGGFQPLGKGNNPSKSMVEAYHKANPFKSFLYEYGNLLIAP